MKHLLLPVALLFAALMLLSVFNGYAQGPNLVANPGFESHNGVPRPSESPQYPGPNNLQGLHCVMRGDSSLTYARPGDYSYLFTTFVQRWFRGNLGTSDYYHQEAIIPIVGSGYDATEGAGIPHNWGTDSLETASGDAYAGIGMTREKNRVGKPDGWMDIHEYLATRLEDTLTPGQNYMVKFRYATAEYKTTEANHQFDELNPYYLKRLGVAFLDTTLPIINRYEDTTVTVYTWLNGGNGDMQNTLEFDSANYQLVENGELPYAGPGEWKTFEANFACEYGKPGLKYLVIGNFSQRIPISDIGLAPGATFPNDTNSFQFHFYFYIDDVEVRAIAADSCNCSSIRFNAKTRSDSLQALNAEKCCFTAEIIPSTVSCPFRYIRIKAGGITVSKPPLIDYGDIVQPGSKVYASFCTDVKTDASPPSLPLNSSMPTPRSSAFRSKPSIATAPAISRQIR